MFDRPDKDLLGAGVISAVGAGIVTTFAVNQGQHPLVALAITAIASICGMVCHQFDLI